MFTKLMNRFCLAALAAIGGAVFFGFGADAAVLASGNGGPCDQECRRQVAIARAATARYHDIQAAINDGFVPASPCIALPDGGGAMGVHYLNFARVLNPNLDPAEPEALLYMPNENGEMRLVAVEYLIPTVMSPSSPELFGQHFHPGPMATWALHAWIWRNNPAGMFEDFNTKLTCLAQ